MLGRNTTFALHVQVLRLSFPTELAPSFGLSDVLVQDSYLRIATLLCPTTFISDTKIFRHSNRTKQIELGHTPYRRTNKNGRQSAFQSIFYSSPLVSWLCRVHTMNDSIQNHQTPHDPYRSSRTENYWCWSVHGSFALQKARWADSDMHW